MGVLDQIIDLGLRPQAPPTSDQLSEFSEKLDFDLDSDLKEFVFSSDGASGFIGDDVFVQLWSLDDMTSLNPYYDDIEQCKDLFFFGTDGSNKGYAFVKATGEVVSIDFLEIGRVDPLPQGASFMDFLLHARRNGNYARLATEVTLRLAMPEDSETVANLIYEAFVPFRSEYTDGAFEYTTPNADAIQPRFEEGPIWIAEINGEPVGTVSGMPDGDRFYIRSMAIKPSAQRNGVGQRLLDVLESHARGAGFEKLYLYTTHVLPGAKRLYEKNGFYVLRETAPEEWFDMGGLEMEKDLRS